MATHGSYKLPRQLTLKDAENLDQFERHETSEHLGHSRDSTVHGHVENPATVYVDTR